MGLTGVITRIGYVAHCHRPIPVLLSGSTGAVGLNEEWTAQIGQRPGITGVDADEKTTVAAYYWSTAKGILGF
jgi:hypothetical protein